MFSDSQQSPWNFKLLKINILLSSHEQNYAIQSLHGSMEKHVL